VIGTLWSVRDDIARDMAIRVHGALESGPAEAVHQAVTELRDQCEGGSPALWAGYLHIGP
jgi:CHAT domain-containing protein